MRQAFVSIGGEVGPRMVAIYRWLSLLRSSVRILYVSCAAPFFSGVTSRRYRSRHSRSVVFSDSVRDTKLPRSISLSICLVQVSASRKAALMSAWRGPFTSKFLEVAGKPLRRTFTRMLMTFPSFFVGTTFKGGHGTLPVRKLSRNCP